MKATIILLMSVVLAGCSDGPSNTASAPDPLVREPQLSTIATPITIPIDQLRRLAEGRLSGEIYKESHDVGVGTSMEVTVRRRASEITMRMTGNTLTTNVPLNLTGVANVGVGPFRIRSPGGLDADLDVTLNTTVSLNPDWSVTSSTSADIDVGRARLDVAGNDLDVTAIVNEIVRRNAQRISEPLDSYLQDLDLRSLVEPVWRGFAAPIQVSENPAVWLRVRPVGFSLSPPAADDGDLRFDLGMEMYLDSVLGNRPTDNELGPIPQIEKVSDKSGTFRVAIPIAVELDEATVMLSNQFIGRTDRIGDDATVHWLGIELSGRGDRLVASVQFEAKTGWWGVSELTGRMVVEARPSYDSATQTLTMRDVDYELQSDSTLATVADWLLHDELRKRAQAELRFPIGDIIGEIRQDLQDRLGSISLGDFGTMEAKIDSVLPDLASVTGSTVELAVVADGTLSLALSLNPTGNR